jgi:1-acyl-sn-glycerol-3-phosphate acyltransferase
MFTCMDGPTKWLRRAITVPGLVVLCVVDLAALPLLLLGALALDVVGKRRLAAVRFQLAVALVLVFHVIGLFLLLRAFLAGVLFGRERERRLDVQNEIWWATATWRAAVRLYGMRVEVEGDDALEGGPVVLMSRHASLLDILFPVVFVSGPHGLALRYVAKRELLWDPFFDLVGHRVATAFVRRGSREHAAEIAQVEALARDLGPGDGIAIFPEGTRFTEEKRAHVLAKLAQHDAAAHAFAARLKNLLPPHAGGALGLLEHAPLADVVFCAHTGLEGANHLADLRRGTLIGATARIRFWRVIASDIPRGADARLVWLRRWWEDLDAWIETHQPPRATNALAPVGFLRLSTVSLRCSSSRYSSIRRRRASRSRRKP